MHRLKDMKETLVSIAQSQIHGNISEVDAKELGEVIDMIKDLAEAVYYCTITDAMEEKDKEENKEIRYYPYPMTTYTRDRDMDRGTSGRMYYTEPRGGSVEYTGMYDNMPMYEMRDPREGRSPISRKMYIESKEMHHGKEAQMKELEKYMKELCDDITEMVEDASPEEKQLLQQKIATLANKIK